jgi:hypothetical protein
LRSEKKKLHIEGLLNDKKGKDWKGEAHNM